MSVSPKTVRRAWLTSSALTVGFERRHTLKSAHRGSRTKSRYIADKIALHRGRFRVTLAVFANVSGFSPGPGADKIALQCGRFRVTVRPGSQRMPVIWVDNSRTTRASARRRYTRLRQCPRSGLRSCTEAARPASKIRPNAARRQKRTKARYARYPRYPRYARFRVTLSLWVGAPK